MTPLALLGWMLLGALGIGIGLVVIVLIVAVFIAICEAL